LQYRLTSLAYARFFELLLTFIDHGCDFPGCRNAIVLDGNMKTRRDICLAKDAGYIYHILDFLVTLKQGAQLLQHKSLSIASSTNHDPAQYQPVRDPLICMCLIQQSLFYLMGCNYILVKTFAMWIVIHVQFSSSVIIDLCIANNKWKSVCVLCKVHFLKQIVLYLTAKSALGSTRVL